MDWPVVRSRIRNRGSALLQIGSCGAENRGSRKLRIQPPQRGITSTYVARRLPLCHCFVERTEVATTSVVCCTFTMKRWAQLQLALQGLAQQTRQPDEVILVCDHAPDVYAALLELGFRDVYENQLQPGIANARNTGWRAAKGDVLAFLDDDAYPEDDWLEKLIEPIENGRNAVATGGWVMPSGGNVPDWYPEEFYWVFGCSWAGLAGRDMIRNPIGASMAWRRSALESIGGFPADFGRAPERLLGSSERVTREASLRRSASPNTCDETLAAILAGNNQGVIIQAEHSVVHHYVARERTTLKYLLKRCWGEGVTKACVQQVSGQPLREESIHGLRILRNLANYSRRRSGWRSVSFSLLGLLATTSGFSYGRLTQITFKGRRVGPSYLQASESLAGQWKPVPASRRIDQK